MIHNVKAQLERVSAQLPSDIKLEVIRDQERYIGAALHEITRHLVLGSILFALGMIESGNDRGHLQCGHGLPDVIKDFRHPHDHVGPVPVLVPIMVCRRRSATAQRDFASALQDPAPTANGNRQSGQTTCL